MIALKNYTASQQKRALVYMILKSNYEYYQNKFNLISITYETVIFNSDIEKPDKTSLLY
jgi:hypothetical protein